MKLAQLNIALSKYPMDAPEIKDFVDNLEPVNSIADQSDGFVWRLQDDSGDATSINAFDNPDMLINMSVWDSVDALKNFMFRTHHREIMRRKSEWFYRSAEDTYVLWWIADDHIPTIEEAKLRLDYLRHNGDSPYAFTFKSNYTPEDAATFKLEV
ncbi:DUF3291 domain-containing protein [Photobacterium sp. CCB-ST2H9]|uniref:DUF3291 domain-containing protein n=1 Tax=Photobacterium sp. CCB-ST2H9 TaxID=2912855 RepID=UPI002003FAFD|nr:DUF3291 domain-containing protein [Photobacterium sp. CCB-ST2H9]UTM60322.1 DUF3291 domain-containing protein [Photobacterium sp. CCB-ST2H9]